MWLTVLLALCFVCLVSGFVCLAIAAHMRLESWLYRRDFAAYKQGEQ